MCNHCNWAEIIEDLQRIGVNLINTYTITTFLEKNQHITPPMRRAIDRALEGAIMNIKEPRALTPSRDSV